MGKSLLDTEKIDYCKEMMAKAEAKGVKLLLPVDTVIAASFPDPIDGPIDVKTVAADAIPDDMEGLDIGEESRKLFAEAAKTAKTVVWNGPMGVFEKPHPGAGHHRCCPGAGRLRRRDQSWAAATARLPASSWALPTRLPTSPPAAAPPWSSWKAWSCPASPACRTSNILRSRHAFGHGKATPPGSSRGPRAKAQPLGGERRRNGAKERCPFGAA